MEIKTSNEIANHLDSVDSLDSDNDDYLAMYGSAKWVSVEQLIKFCNDWFDTKRKNNEMWRLNQDELSGMFLNALEKGLKRGN